MSNREWHGMSDLTEYQTWKGMKQRCYNPNDPRFERYGDRGITVCDAWKNSFTAFYQDMGPKPSPKHSIDRIDNDGNYEPGNCRWATPSEQMWNTSHNRPIELPDGSVVNYKEASERLNLKIPTIKNRIYSDIPLDQPPIYRDKTYRYKGKDYTIGQLAKLNDMEVSTVQSRLNRGWTVEEAVFSPVVENTKHQFKGQELQIHEIARITGIPAYSISHHIRKGRTAEQAVNRIKLAEIEKKAINKYRAEYNLWNKIQAVCSNPNHPDYKYYGAKGATVSDEWQESFIYFLNAVGPKPGDEYVLKRIDESKPYEAGNVEWRHKSQGTRNVPTTVKVKLADGREVTAAEAATILGITKKGVYERLRTGVPIDTPGRGMYMFQGKLQSLRSISEQTGIPFRRLQKRLVRHNIDEAVAMG